MYVAIRNTQYAIRNTLKLKAFTLVELLSTIAIIAILVTAAVVYIPNYVSWAKQTADKQTLTVLNDALNRYKCQGGDINALTLGAPIGNVISRLQTPVDWAGLQHQFLQTGVTFQGKSLEAIGSRSQYQFYKYNSYSNTTPTLGTPTSKYPLGFGVGYMANGSAKDYTVQVQTTTGRWAYLPDGSSTPVVVTGNTTIPACAGFTFWSCAGASDSTPSGNITNVITQSNALTSLNLKALTGLANLDCSWNNFTTLDISSMPSIANVYAISCSSLSLLNASYCPSLTYLRCDGCALGTIDITGNTGLGGGLQQWSNPAPVIVGP